MSEQHTPEPWSVRDTSTKSSCSKNWREIESSHRGVVQASWFFHGDETECGVWITEANARRIVAAVNACQGIPTEALESGALKMALDLLGFAYAYLKPETASPEFAKRVALMGTTLSSLGRDVRSYAERLAARAALQKAGGP